MTQVLGSALLDRCTSLTKMGRRGGGCQRHSVAGCCCADVPSCCGCYVNWLPFLPAAVQIPAHKVKLVVGAGGEKIKFIQKKTKCRIQVGNWEQLAVLGAAVGWFACPLGHCCASSVLTLVCHPHG